MVRVAHCFVGSCFVLLAATNCVQAQYRGMAPGWPNHASAETTAYYAPAYGAPYGQPMYYVARPVGAAANYAISPNVPAPYVPVTAAYANPAYNGGYNTARYAAPRPVVAAYYAPQGGAYYSPATVQYAPTNSYSVSPAGAGSAGAEAYPHYGQPTTVNYVPPRFAYRATYAQVPVYMYRPVTAYDPVTAQPVTCLQPATTTQCQTQRHRWFTHSWFSHSWFKWHRACGAGGCGAPPPTIAYCGTYPTTCNSGQCGQPYYPVQPNVVIPAVPAPVVSPGWTPVPAGPVGPTVPPPPTRVIPGPSGGFVPADTIPRLTPGSPPRTTFPGTTLPSFQVDPPTTPSAPFNPSPATPINPGGFGGSPFPSGTNYAPSSDPYSKSSAAITNRSTAGISSTPIRPPQREADALRPAIQSPSGPTLAPGVQAIPDPEAQEPARPINRAPQLLDPRDKTARLESASRGDQRWAVVPAVWPKPTPAAPALEAPTGSPYRVYHERAYTAPQTPAVNPAEYDDSGWRSAR